MSYIKKWLYYFDNNGKKDFRNKLSVKHKSLIKAVIKIIFFINRRRLVIVLSNGKAGSSAVLDALNKSGLTVFQLHEVDINRIREHVGFNLRSRKKAVPLHLLVSQVFIESKFIDYSKVRYIVIYRNDPAQNLSAMFQNYDMYDHANLKSIEFCKNEMQKIHKDNIEWEGNILQWLSLNTVQSKVINLNYSESYSWSSTLSEYFEREIRVYRMNVGEQKFYNKEYSYMKSQIL